MHSTVTQECFNTIARHYAIRLREAGIETTRANIEKAMQISWPRVQKEITMLYRETVTLIKADKEKRRL